MRARSAPILLVASLFLAGPASAQLVIDGQNSVPGVTVDMSVLGVEAPSTNPAPIRTPVVTQPQGRIAPFIPPLPPRRPAPPPLLASTAATATPPQPAATVPAAPPPPVNVPQPELATGSPDLTPSVETLTPQLSTGPTLPDPPSSAGDRAPRPEVISPEPLPTPTPPGTVGDSPPAQPPVAESQPTTPRPAGEMPDARPTAPPPVADVEGENVTTLPDNSGYRIIYEPGSESIPRTGGVLVTGLAQRLIDEPDTRVQIRAFASDTEDNPSQARRLSLNRALALRTLFIDAGVRGTRLDVRALGDTADDPPRDRIDLLINP